MITDRDDIPEWMTNALALESFEIIKATLYIGTTEYRIYCTICGGRTNNLENVGYYTPEIWAEIARHMRRKHVVQAVCKQYPAS